MCLRVGPKRDVGKPCKFPLDAESFFYRAWTGDDFSPETMGFRHLAMGKVLGSCSTLEADVPVVSVDLFSGVVRVGHDADRTRHRWLLAEGVLVVLVDIAHFFSPLAETVVAALGNDHLDAAGVLVGDYGAHRRAVLPDVHQRRVGHLVARQHLHLAREQPVLERPLRGIALKSDNHAHGGILAVAPGVVGAGDQLGHFPAPPEQRKLPRVNAHVLRETRRGSVGGGLDDGPAVLLDEAVLGGFFVLPDAPGTPARGQRLSGLAGRELSDRSHDDDALRRALDHRATCKQYQRRYRMSPRHPPVPSRSTGSVGENPVSDSPLTGSAELPSGVDEP